MCWRLVLTLKLIFIIVIGPAAPQALNRKPSSPGSETVALPVQSEGWGASYRPAGYSYRYEDSVRSLSILLLGLPFIGHLAPLLAVGEELVRRGHNVSLCTTVVEGDRTKPRGMAAKAGVHFIDAGSSSVEVRRLVTDEAYKLHIVESEDFISRVFRVSDMTVYENIVMEKFLSNFTSSNEWDIVIGIEYVYPLLACIAEKRKIPTVVLNTKTEKQFHTLPHWPFPSGGAQTDNLSFLQRLQNQLWASFMYRVDKYWTIRHIKNNAVDLCQSSSVDYMLTAPSDYIPQLVPTSIGFEFPRTRSPLTEYVGPLISSIPQNIPKSMKLWLDSKPPGSVVYISMGSIYPLTAPIARSLLDGVMGTSHCALWSLRRSNYDFTMEGVEVDENRILIVEWTPQSAIFQHRAIGLAILHGGMSGLHETLTAGIPSVLIPLSSDQPANSIRAQHSGAAVMLNLRDISTDTIIEALKKINSREYRKAAHKMSRIFQEAGGAKKAADLVEFYADVGYDHLVPAYAKYNWSWVQYYNVDVYITLTVCVALVLAIVVAVSIWLCHIVAHRLFKMKED